jgi:hypothetical protein
MPSGSSLAVSNSIKYLRLLLSDDTKVLEFVDSSFRSVTPEAIQRWMDENLELLPEDVRRLYFENQLTSPLTKRILRKWWGIVEFYLGSPENTINALVRANERNKEILMDPRIREYIHSQLTNAYEYLKSLVMA